MICAGIDAGSRAIKAVLFNTDGPDVIASATIDQGVAQERLAQELFEHVLEQAGIARCDVATIVATGYGRHVVDLAERAVTEITCHARGVRHLLPDARTVIDIGGQDSKLITLDNAGRVEDFAMNDRCAAGTGSFLEVAARRLGFPLEELGAAACRSRSPAAISSMCVVFAETEIVGLLATGCEPDDIVAGVLSAIASRMCTMAGRCMPTPVAFTGGVARIPGMAEALATALGQPVTTCPEPQLTGALGAALIASEIGAKDPGGQKAMPSIVVGGPGGGSRRMVRP